MTIQFVTFGMFIIDEFSYADEQGKPTGEMIGGGGTYAAIGARMWLPPDTLGMIVDRGNDFPQDIQNRLLTYGSGMWHFRDDMNRVTTRSMNSYRGEYRGFEYTTPRIRLTPRDLDSTRLTRPASVHFICSPTRALQIISEIQEIEGWNPTAIFEPIPDRCIPEELPSLKAVLPHIAILSPNAEEALALLSLPSIVTKTAVENAASEFLKMGVGKANSGSVIIRSGALGAYVITSDREGQWVDAFWSSAENIDKVVDVTGAGNSFLGGLAAGLFKAKGDIYEATLYASVSASFTVEQLGLPHLTLSNGVEEWNQDSPHRRLEVLRQRQDREIENKNH
ncbi:Ribokinase-like protein [Suillus clintonianus]|uniref:Ribokinase-like protein n=1 Tax=Suillus clintonianus TaxID=1904413 RepID=UPI001B8816F6|nr:Ribokinase-like protein [Suillus clintonianus]KAG2152948.1 Ribokinase-like protein [Suillus clintonianus]